MGLEENNLPTINICNLIAFVHNNTAIVFCNDLRDQFIST